MTHSEFQKESEYIMALQMAKTMHEKCLLTDDELCQIDTILREKYAPLFGALLSETTCYSKPVE